MNVELPAWAADITARLNRIEALLCGRSNATGEVLTRPEAKTYVKRKSDRAFGRWCKKWRVKSVAHGRYSRTQLDLALSREARLRR